MSVNRATLRVSTAPAGLVAHPDISLVLRGDDDPVAARLKALQQAYDRRRRRDGDAPTPSTANVIAAMAADSGPRLDGLCRRTRVEGFRAIRAALVGTGCLLLAVPYSPYCSAICWRGDGRTDRLLEEGAERIGTGRFDHKIAISTGDELERPPVRFNEMAENWRCPRNAPSELPG